MKTVDKIKEQGTAGYSLASGIRSAASDLAAYFLLDACS